MSYDVNLYVDVDTGGPKPVRTQLNSWNYTCNVYGMFDLAGVLPVIKSDGTMRAAAAIPILEKGLRRMQDRPGDYRALNPPNGWGDYEGAMRFLQGILDGCRQHPKALIGTWY